MVVLKVLFWIYLILAPICVIISIIQAIRGKKLDAILWLVWYLVFLTLIGVVYFLMLI